MSILKVARMGHPVLRKDAEEVSKREIALPQTQQLIADMVESMADHDGIGLAAPQVHVSKKLCIIHVPEMPKLPQIQEFPLTVLFNPKLTLSGDTINIWEGCLSVPGIRGLVPRRLKVHARYLDLKGKERQLEATGFLAAVIQHEVDHLQSTLFVDRVEQKEMLAFTKEWGRYMSEVPDYDEGTVTFL